VINFKYFQEYAGKGTSHPRKIPLKNQTISQLTKKKGTIGETSVGKIKPGKRQRNNGAGYIIREQPFAEGFSVPDVHTKAVLNF
jgi:hypothetical protein